MQQLTLIACYILKKLCLGVFQCNDGFVDGHDVGQGTFNIFIHVRSSWDSVLQRVEAFLKLRGALEDATIVKFRGKTERYQVVHPATYGGEFAL